MILKKYKSLPITAKAAIWFAVCNIVLKGISFFTVPVFTRLLSTYEYGKLSIFTSYEQLILVLATWEVSIGPYQRGIFKFKDDVKLFTASTQTFANIVTLVFFAVVFIFFDVFNYLTELTIPLTILLFLYLMVQPAYSCWFYRKRVEYDYKKSVSVSLGITLFCVIASVIAVLLLGGTANIKFAFTLIPAIIVYCYFYFAQIHNTGLIKNKDKVQQYWKFLFNFTPPLVVHAISYYILGQVDRIMISKMVGNESAAIYSVAYTLAGMAIIVQNAVQQVMLPWIYQNIEEKRFVHIKKTATTLFVGIGIVYLAFILVTPEVVRIMYPAAYYEGIWCIPPIAIGSYFMFFYSMFVNVESYYEETKYIAYVSSLCAILNVVLNYFGIRLFGYIACAYTTLICYILFAIGHYYFMKKTLKKHANGIAVYDGKLIAIICISVLVLMMGITVSYNYIIVRYVILAAAMLVAIFFRQKLLLFINKLKSNRRMKDDIK